METNEEQDRYYFTTTQLQKVSVHLLYMPLRNRSWSLQDLMSSTIIFASTQNAGGKAQSKRLDQKLAALLQEMIVANNHQQEEMEKMVTVLNNICKKAQILPIQYKKIQLIRRIQGSKLIITLYMIKLYIIRWN